MKRCKKCRELKDETCFYKASYGNRSRMARCMDCFKVEIHKKKLDKLGIKIDGDFQYVWQIIFKKKFPTPLAGINISPEQFINSKLFNKPRTEYNTFLPLYLSQIKTN